jgi:DNA-binding beta-propeller fold protein YncE
MHHRMTTAGIRIRRAALALAAVAAILAGCASKPDLAGANKAAAEAGPVFYPALPNPPRVQYLTTIVSERDLAVEKDSFADFIAGEEKKEQRLVQPYGVAMHEGRLYVADTGAGGISIFDLNTKRYSFMAGAGPGRLKRPINIRIDRDGTRYVTDTARDQVLVYDRDGNFLRAFGTQGQFRPVDVAIAGDKLYVTDIAHHEVQVLDKATGNLRFKFGKAGSGPGELFHPTNIALGPDGDIYVVETSNYRVQRFTQDGKPVRSYGEVGSTPGTFARPKGIAMDKSGNMLVGDTAFQNVQMFDGQGRLLMFFGQPEAGSDGINLPAGVTVDYDNVAVFKRYAHPKFKVEYLVLVASQYGPNKVDVFGFGKLEGMDYPDRRERTPQPAS